MALMTGAIDCPPTVPDTHRATGPIWVVHTVFEAVATAPARSRRFLTDTALEIRGWHALVFATTYLTLCAAVIAAVTTR